MFPMPENKLQVLIAGDNYMIPDLIQGIIEKQLDEKLYGCLRIKKIKFPFPEEVINLTPETIIPSGMSWCDFAIPRVAEGISEFYGEVDALQGQLEDIDILIVHGAAVPGFVLQEARRLKLIGLLRGGPKNIDIETARRLKLKMVNTPGKTDRAVAETTLGGLLSLTRNIAQSAYNLKRNRIWESKYYDYSLCGTELADKTLGLIGFGHIARVLVGLLRGFQLKKIYAYDPFQDPADLESLGVELVNLEKILEDCEIISLHARLTDSSSGLIGQNQFEMMKKKPVLVNTARGGLVDYRALIRALRSGSISGAMIDVFGDEPFGVYEELIDMPQVVATPHIAGGARETVHRASHMIAEELKRFLTGQPPLHEYT
jgi:D-3-phosphoglycerate dehydrogenase